MCSVTFFIIFMQEFLEIFLKTEISTLTNFLGFNYFHIHFHFWNINKLQDSCGLLIYILTITTSHEIYFLKKSIFSLLMISQDIKYHLTRYIEIYKKCLYLHNKNWGRII